MRPAEDALFAGEASDRIESVSEFTRRVKLLLESGLRPGWVRGEVSNLRAQASGHVYFSLKDAGAQLSAVLFRGDAARQKVALRDGQQILAYGEVSVYEQRGQYQLIVRVVVEDGIGRLQREFEALKRRLADEGLFAAEKKRRIPPLQSVKVHRFHIVSLHLRASHYPEILGNDGQDRAPNQIPWTFARAH